MDTLKIKFDKNGNLECNVTAFYDDCACLVPVGNLDVSNFDGFGESVSISE